LPPAGRLRHALRAKSNLSRTCRDKLRLKFISRLRTRKSAMRYACLPPGGGKCGDPTLSNRKSAVLMAPRFLLLGKNSVKPCKYRPFGGRL
jgi:hypothetical protein